MFQNVYNSSTFAFTLKICWISILFPVEKHCDQNPRAGFFPFGWVPATHPLTLPQNTSSWRRNSFLSAGACEVLLEFPREGSRGPRWAVIRRFLTGKRTLSKTMTWFPPIHPGFHFLLPGLQVIASILRHSGSWFGILHSTPSPKAHSLEKMSYYYAKVKFRLMSYLSRVCAFQTFLF